MDDDDDELAMLLSPLALVLALCFSMGSPTDLLRSRVVDFCRNLGSFGPWWGPGVGVGVGGARGGLFEFMTCVGRVVSRRRPAVVAVDVLRVVGESGESAAILFQAEIEHT